MPTIDKYNFKDLLINKKLDVDMQHGFKLENNNYSCFNTLNYKAPELIPVIDIIQYFFKIGIPIGDYTHLSKVRKYYDNKYVISFKVSNSTDVYRFVVSDDLNCIQSIFKNNRRIDLNDYIELMNSIYYDTAHLKKVLV